jgi:demethoxyubiquinone hydroxylase (CLK1/Coq7/Cat5 family)
LFNLKTILNAIGVKIDDYHIEQLQQLLPQIPAKLNEFVTWSAKIAAHYDTRLNTLETEIKQLRSDVQAYRDDRQRFEDDAKTRHEEMLEMLTSLKETPKETPRPRAAAGSRR